MRSEKLTTAALILAGLVNVFPVIGIASADVLARLYGIPAPEGDLLILMRHRALLFGILGVLILTSIFRRHLQPTAIVAGLVSMLGFVVLALVSGDYGAKIHNVMRIDIVASIPLAAVAVRRGSIDWRGAGGRS